MPEEILEWVLRKPEENRLYSTSAPAEYIRSVLISKINHSVEIVYTDQKPSAKIIKGSLSYIKGLAHGLYITTGIHFTPQQYETS